MSFTNVSLLAEELLACGTVPVINDSPYARADVESGYVRWAPPTPSGVADTVLAILNAPPAAAKVAATARPDAWRPAQAVFLRSVEDEVYGDSADGCHRSWPSTQPFIFKAMAVTSSAPPASVNHDYVSQMRDAYRDMPQAADRLTVAELRTFANYWRHRVLRSRGRSRLQARAIRITSAVTTRPGTNGPSRFR